MKTALRHPLPGRRVHFVGIGGAGMAALAELLLEMGYEVSGSDLKESRATRRLVELGARIRTGLHEASAVDGAEHVVVSAAVRGRNPEVERAEELGLDRLSRAELLGRVFDAGRGIGVSGTHGKTTTASMLAQALDGAGLAPSFVVGGDLNDVGSGARLGAGDLVVAEADEAYGSFLELRSELVVVTNVDLDHLDHYVDQDAIDEAFIRFCDARSREGAAVLCADDPGIRRIASRLRGPLVTYGTGEADLSGSPSGAGWDLRWRGEPIGTLRLRVPGDHNALNAMGATAAALELGADPGPVLEALEGFGGVERRFSVRGRAGGVEVVDDYAHNPRKVAATLSAARTAYPGARVVVLFQPHLYSRTRHLAEDFGGAFSDADIVVVTDVYGAREEPEPGVSGALVVEAIRRVEKPRPIVNYVPRLDEAAGFVAGLAEPGDVVLTLGAGDVTRAAPRILELLGSSEGEQGA